MIFVYKARCVQLIEEFVIGILDIKLLDAILNATVVLSEKWLNMSAAENA